METRKKDIIIIILAIIVVILFIYILVDKLFLNKESSKDPSLSTTTTSTTSTTTSSTTTNSNTTTTSNTTKITDLSANEAISLLKRYYKSLGSDYYDESNTIIWDINNIQYLGYYSSDENAKYYVAKGSFTCKNNADDCIYVEQEIDDTNNFVSAFIVKYANSEYSISQLIQPTFDIQVKNDPDTKKGFILVDEKLK